MGVLTVESSFSMHAAYQSGEHSVTAYLSRPRAFRPWPGVVLVHEWRGLDEHSRELSRRLAREGFAVLVPDLYDGRLTDDRQQAAAWKVALDADRAARYVVDGAAFLAGLPYVDPGAVGVLGFCLGGGVALLALAQESVLRCGVIYYQSLYPDDEQVAAIKQPLLCHYGTADRSTPVDEVKRFEGLLRAAGADFSCEWYEGAGHAFFNDRLMAEYEAHNALPGQYDPERNRAAAEASWPKTLAFLRRHLRAGA